jgi:hypothetical protein
LTVLSRCLEKYSERPPAECSRIRELQVVVDVTVR